MAGLSPLICLRTCVRWYPWQSKCIGLRIFSCIRWNRSQMAKSTIYIYISELQEKILWSQINLAKTTLPQRNLVTPAVLIWMHSNEIFYFHHTSEIVVEPTSWLLPELRLACWENDSKSFSRGSFSIGDLSRTAHTNVLSSKVARHLLSSKIDWSGHLAWRDGSIFRISRVMCRSFRPINAISRRLVLDVGGKLARRKSRRVMTRW